MNSNKKEKAGQVFSIDAIIGAFIVGIIIIIVVFNTTHRLDPQEIQISKIGYDLLNVMNDEGTLQTFHSETIEDRMEKLLPSQYGMRIAIESNFKNFEAGDDPPAKKFIASGKIVFTKAQTPSPIDVNGIATFYIWVK